jgi:hypothetical protein
LAFLTILAAAAVAQAAPEPVGMWSTAADWETDQFGEGPGGYCVTRSKVRSQDGVSYTIFMTFGGRNEVGLSTNAKAQTRSNGVFDVEGGGLDLSDLRPRTEGGKFVLFNSLTKPMFRLLIDDVKSAHSIRFELGGKSYFAPIADPDAVYSQMIECQESLLGLVIGNLK